MCLMVDVIVRQCSMFAFFSVFYNKVAILSEGVLFGQAWASSTQVMSIKIFLFMFVSAIRHSVHMYLSSIPVICNVNAHV